MKLRRPPTVPGWLVVPIPATRAFAWAFCAWAAWKWLDAMTPRMCGGPSPLQAPATFMAMAEAAIGLALALGGSELRAKAALVGAAAMTGLVGFAFVARARGLPTKHCFCFGGIDLPWAGHAAVAAALAVAFLAVLLDAERRRAPSA